MADIDPIGLIGLGGLGDGFRDAWEALRGDPLLQDIFGGIHDVLRYWRTIPGFSDAFWDLVNILRELQLVRRDLEARRAELQDETSPLHPYRHCIMSCEVTHEYGRVSTRVLGLINELQGLIWWDIPRLRERLEGQSEWAFQIVDFVDNEAGIWCAEEHPEESCEDCCTCSP